MRPRDALRSLFSTTVPISCTVALIAIAGCERAGRSNVQYAYSPPSRVEMSAPPVATGSVVAMAPAAPAQDTRAASLGAGRKLVRTVDLELVVRDPDAASRAIQKIVTDAQGYVATLDARHDDSGVSCHLTVRVPVAGLDAALARIRALAVSVDHEQQQVQDVTEERIDVDARLRALNVTETELLGLLSRSRGQRGEDIMSIYGQLTDIRGQIESLEGRRSAIDRMAAYSTVNLHLRRQELAQPIQSSAWHPTATVHLATRALVSLLRLFGNVAIMLVVVVVPVVAILFAPVGLVVWARKRLRARAQPMPEA